MGAGAPGGRTRRTPHLRRGVRVAAGRAPALTRGAVAAGRGHPDDEPGYEVQYPELVLVVGLAPAPVEATLGRLGLALSLLSADLWVSAAVVGAAALPPPSRR